MRVMPALRGFAEARSYQESRFSRPSRLVKGRCTWFERARGPPFGRGISFSSLSPPSS